MDTNSRILASSSGVGGVPLTRMPSADSASTLSGLTDGPSSPPAPSSAGISSLNAIPPLDATAATAGADGSAATDLPPVPAPAPTATATWAAIRPAAASLTSTLDTAISSGSSAVALQAGLTDRDPGVGPTTTLESVASTPTAPLPQSLANGPISFTRGFNALLTDPQVVIDAADSDVVQPQAQELNAIALENMKQGTPESVWRSTTPGDRNIEGFATEISINHGQTVSFKINTDSTNYRIDIYRLGYYGGDGARLVTSIQRTLDSAQVQPHPIVDYSLGLIDCGNWGVSASWNVPADAVSGVYLAKLVREDGTPGVNEIPFIVRDDESHSDMVFQTSDTTWQAYNAWGGASFYGGDVPLNPDDMLSYQPPNCHCGLQAIGRAYAVSYNRPFITNDYIYASGPQDYLFGAEYSAIRWLEENGYDVSYISGVDTARSGQELMNHQAFLSVGHDEYWSADQRANVEAARDAGVNLAFFSGNEVYWKTRWEDSIDGSGTPYRTLVCYKETWANSDIDPTDINTGTWRDERFMDPGQQPENALTGTMFTVDSYRLDTITVPYDMSQFRFWRNTDISQLQPGETGALVTGLLGYEWDSDVDNGFRPAGLVDLSLSTVSVNTYLLDYGSVVGDNPAAQHSLTMYRADSGAIVFGAGTVYWSWGLDDHHDNEVVPTDPNVQQAMVNLFADMGIQPDTLDASLVIATGTTDHTAPTSTVTSVSSGGDFLEGEDITVTGTAQDSGGGKVAGVEVSIDSGTTWHKATGFNTWTYSGRVEAAGNYTVLARAVDDSLNMQATPTAGTPITVNHWEGSTLWTYADKPADTDSEFIQDFASVELGMKFQTTVSGTITSISFYKSFLNQGTHTAHLWTGDGTLLASATFTNETDSGWQTVTFSQPVAVTAGTTYVASYHTGNRYSATTGYFDTARTSGQLVAPVGAGVYAYGDTTVFPDGTFGNENYWVDVQFISSPNHVPIAVDDSGFNTAQDTPLVIAASSLTANDTDTDHDALSVTGVSGATHGTVALNAQAQTVTFTPTAGYTGPAGFTYTASDGRGGSASANVSLTVDQPGTGVSLFPASAAPTTITESDPLPVELGMKFQASSAGTITGIKFYKGPQNTGVHEAHLWSSTGTLLATATFTGESASGWQTATFTSPVTIAANTTYIASYHSNGFYSADSNYFASAVTNGPLTALGSGDSGGNGVYSYGASGLFPTASYGSTNYWVDVVYEQGSAANNDPVAANDSGFGTPRDTALTIAAAALLANDSDPDNDPLSIVSVGGASHGTIALNAQAQTVTFTPTTGYDGTAGFTYTISDGHGGSATASVALNVNAPGTALSIFAPSAGPTGPAEDDPAPVELGVKFQASSAGTIAGIKFYKSAQDTGVHQAHLWSSSGTLLATATFGNETASGWQTATFASPVTIAANTTYIASYHSNGDYAATSNYFTTAVTNGPLTALASGGAAGGNGVYAYGASGVFPNATYSNTNYWVDVVYNQGSGTNNNPVAANDSGFSTSENTTLAVPTSALLANDTDLDGDPLTVTAVGSATGGVVSLNAQAQTAVFTPNTGYTGAAQFSYTIGDGRGGSASATVSLTVNAPSTGISLFSPSDTPATLTDDDPSPVELGMKFTSDVAGTITGIKFYKGPQNTGAHEGHLWNADGTLLATATFTNETASGWQTANLNTPVAITPGTTYIASYHTGGNYSATGNYFDTDHSNGPLHASASTTASGNGVYAYGGSGLFPSGSYNKSNYWVDVVFNGQLAA